MSGKVSGSPGAGQCRTHFNCRSLKKVMKILPAFNFLLGVNSDRCDELKIGQSCYKEIIHVDQSLTPAGKIISGDNVKDGYSPLGSNKKIPCPDGTFAYRERVFNFPLVSS